MKDLMKWLQGQLKCSHKLTRKHFPLYDNLKDFETEILGLLGSTWFVALIIFGVIKFKRYSLS